MKTKAKFAFTHCPCLICLTPIPAPPTHSNRREYPIPYLCPIFSFCFLNMEQEEKTGREKKICVWNVSKDRQKVEKGVESHASHCCLHAESETPREAREPNPHCSPSSGVPEPSRKGVEDPSLSNAGKAYEMESMWDLSISSFPREKKNGWI